MPYFNVFEAFNSLDQNDSGCISREEFKRLIMSRGFYVSEKEATEIVEKMDKNKNGRVSFAEVSRLITCTPSNSQARSSLKPVRGRRRACGMKRASRLQAIDLL